MASNPNAPFGLRPIRHLKGGLIRFNDYYTILDGYTTSLFFGDPVVCSGTGMNVGIATGSSSSVITGVFAGCEYVNLLGDTIWSKYWPASTSTNTAFPIKAFVYDDPDLVFEVQSDATGIAAADIRQLANFHSGTGSTVTGLSGWYLTVPTTTENQAKILTLARNTNPGAIVNAYGAYAVVEVAIAFHELAGNMQEL
jgi:hypothetical protein